MAETLSVEQQAYVDSVRKTFQEFDKDGDGYVTAAELKVAMQKMGDTLTDEQITAMIKEADYDGDGKVNLPEFEKILAKATLAARG